MDTGVEATPEMVFVKSGRAGAAGARGLITVWPGSEALLLRFSLLRGGLQASQVQVVGHPLYPIHEHFYNSIKCRFSHATCSLSSTSRVAGTSTHVCSIG